MAGEAQDNNWPLPKFYFMVDWGETKNTPFQEANGLDVETQLINYRHGNNQVFPEISMPGLLNNGHVTMRKGVFTNNDDFWSWYDKMKTHTIARQNVVIKLLDEGGNLIVTWTLNNAWPTNISSTDLNSDGSEVAVESIEIAHEGLTIANA